MSNPIILTGRAATFETALAKLMKNVSGQASSPEYAPIPDSRNFKVTVYARKKAANLRAKNYTGTATNTDYFIAWTKAMQEAKIPIESYSQKKVGQQIEVSESYRPVSIATASGPTLGKPKTSIDTLLM